AQRHEQRNAQVHRAAAYPYTQPPEALDVAVGDRRAPLGRSQLDEPLAAYHQPSFSRKPGATSSVVRSNWRMPISFIHSSPSPDAPRRRRAAAAQSIICWSSASLMAWSSRALGDSPFWLATAARSSSAHTVAYGMRSDWRPLASLVTSASSGSGCAADAA